jgi:hypothetical protein
MNIKIISEDDYGGEFLKNVIAKLKDEKLVGNITIKGSKPMLPLCNSKLDRILKAFDNTCDKILVILDSDEPQNREFRRTNVERHKPTDMTTPVEIILTDYEIEEWICISKNLKWGHSKPSDELKSQFRYKKSSLPKYASELDFDKLIKKSKPFIDFLNALQPNQ